MKRAKGSSKPVRKPDPGRVSIRTIYCEALREVMADPLKAVAEHDPWLAALLTSGPPRAVPKG